MYARVRCISYRVDLSVENLLDPNPSQNLSEKKKKNITLLKIQSQTEASGQFSFETNGISWRGIGRDEGRGGEQGRMGERGEWRGRARAKGSIYERQA